MEDYQIIENFLDLSECDSIVDSLNKELTWEFENFGDSGIFLKKNIYENEVPVLEVYNDLVDLMNKMQIIGLMDIQLNAYLNNTNIELVEKPNKHKFNHGVGIYYLNTNNGYTLLDNGTKINSEKNKLLLFQSDQKYYESNTTDSKVRYNLTFNYM